ncbi:UNKNOWN [Stylonychia lemnae]|uniref:Uncharacterized protein n=1 Tax=Stylonychia lemnae TaxID=5949 RepID=A0A077ZU96_STYLE|nr:UNKNOWN [Stylonychia lemnae]|eukprot:CDW72036.1 UNKNOWN [Stylonychia lemnae]
MSLVRLRRIVYDRSSEQIFQITAVQMSTKDQQHQHEGIPQHRRYNQPKLLVLSHSSQPHEKQQNMSFDKKTSFHPEEAIVNKLNFDSRRKSHQNETINHEVHLPLQILQNHQQLKSKIDYRDLTPQKDIISVLEMRNQNHIQKSRSIHKQMLLENISISNQRQKSYLDNHLLQSPDYSNEYLLEKLSKRLPKRDLQDQYRSQLDNQEKEMQQINKIRRQNGGLSKIEMSLNKRHIQNLQFERLQEFSF